MNVTVKKSVVNTTTQFELLYRGHQLSFKDLPGAMCDLPTMTISTAGSDFLDDYIMSHVDSGVFDVQMREVDDKIGDALTYIKEHIEINTRIFCYLTNMKYSTITDIINIPSASTMYNELIATPTFLTFIKSRFNKDSWDIKNAPAVMRENINQVVIGFNNFFAKSPQHALNHILSCASFTEIETEQQAAHKTPDNVAKKMVNTLPQSVLVNPNSTFLDPCCGTGTIVFELIKKLQKYHSLTHILENMIYINDIEPKYITLVKIQLEQLHLKHAGRIISYNNATTTTFVGVNMERKFDVIIGNPPYNAPNSNNESTNNASLYIDFVDMCRKHVVDNGYISLVIPSRWTAVDLCVTTDIYNAGLIDIFDTTEHFNIEVDTCAILLNKNHTSQTRVTTACGDVRDIDWDGTPSLALKTNNSQYKILQHLKSYATMSDLWSRSAINNNHPELHNDERDGDVRIVKTVGQSGAAPIYYYINQSICSHNIDSWKVIVGNLGTVSANKRVLGAIKVLPPQTTTSFSVVSLPCSSEQQANSLKSLLETKLFKMLVHLNKNANPNSKTLFGCLPLLPFTQVYTDADVYTALDISEEFVEYVEEFHK